MILYDKITDILPSWSERTSGIIKKYASLKVCDVTVEQIFSGIRGVQIQVSDISYVDPKEGIRLRGFTVPEILQKLPKYQDANYPMAGGLYFLLMTDTLPTAAQAMEVESEWKYRNRIPEHVLKTLQSMPENTHPMTLFSQAITAMQTESLFAKKYSEGLHKKDYWKYYLEDSMNLTACLPSLAAMIYNLRYRQGKLELPDTELDWSANFAHMIGKGDNSEYQDLCRLFFILHSDHEGANVSTHTSHLVSSALTDVYLSSAAGMNGLAGPLHGLANQECIRWLLNLREHFDHFPNREDIENYIHDTLASGQVVPGYGHAVLRVTDPRFSAQYEFAEKFLPEDELFNLVKLIYRVTPPVLAASGKIKNPFPNVDAINGTLQYHYGVREFDFYTVLFGVSRILGITAHLVWARALGKPIERPKSLTTKMLEEYIAVSSI